MSSDNANENMDRNEDKNADTRSRMPWKSVFINICDTLRKRSVCLKYQTGAIVVKGTQILSIGYNGIASKQEECSHYWENYWNRNISGVSFDDWIRTDEFRNLHSKWSVMNEIHAEVNALNWISKGDIDNTYAIYTYYSPCEQCAKQILSYGITQVFYCIKYLGRSASSTDGIKFLQDRGIHCEQLQVRH